jgi:DNA-binding GntR family transcriptional regulator
MTQMDAPQLKAVSIVEALEDDLARRILDGELAPSEHLREIELSERYQVGRHTLRAAFDRLVRRGLLQRARNRGVFVRQFTERDLIEIYELRTALEAQAFRTLAARKEVPEGAREAIDLYRTLTSRSPRGLVVGADLAFHRAIVRATGNTRLARVHENVLLESQLCLAQRAQSYATVRELAAMHRALVEAIETGRPAHAEAAIREHLENAAAWLVEHVAASPTAP